MGVKKLVSAYIWGVTVLGVGLTAWWKSVKESTDLSATCAEVDELLAHRYNSSSLIFPAKPKLHLICANLASGQYGSSLSPSELDCTAVAAELQHVWASIRASVAGHVGSATDADMAAGRVDATPIHGSLGAESSAPHHIVDSIRKHASAYLRDVDAIPVVLIDGCASGVDSDGRLHRRVHINHDTAGQSHIGDGDASTSFLWLCATPDMSSPTLASNHHSAHSARSFGAMAEAIAAAALIVAAGGGPSDPKLTEYESHRGRQQQQQQHRAADAGSGHSSGGKSGQRRGIDWAATAPAGTSAAAVAYMRSQEYSDWMRERGIEVETWASTAASVHVDVALVHAPESGLEATIAALPPSIMEELRSMASQAAAFVDVSITERSALFGRLADEGMLHVFNVLPAAAAVAVNTSTSSSDDVSMGDTDNVSAAAVGTGSTAGDGAAADGCLMFSWDEWSLMPIAALSHDVAYAGAAGATAPKVLYRVGPQTSSGPAGEHNTSDTAAAPIPEILPVMLHWPPLHADESSSHRYQCNREWPSSDESGIGSHADDDAGRSLLQLVHDAKVLLSQVFSTATGVGDAPQVCAPELRYTCSSGTNSGEAATRTVQYYCASNTPPTSSRMIVYIPPADLRPLYIQRFFTAPRNAPFINTSASGLAEAHRACSSSGSSVKYPWPDRFTMPVSHSQQHQAAPVHLDTSADIKGWGSIHVANNAHLAAASGFSARGSTPDSSSGAHAFSASAASALIGHLRRQLGLSSRRPTAVRWDHNIDSSDSVVFQNARSSASIGTVDAAVDASGEQLVQPGNVASSASSPALQLEAEDVAALMSTSAAPAISAFEHAQLFRRWWAVHEQATLLALRATCDITRSQKRMKVPPHIAVGLHASVDHLRNARGSLAETLSSINGTNTSRIGKDSAMLALRLARFHAESLTSDPHLVTDSYLPFVHIMAIYIPLWAPMALPLIIAIIKGTQDYLAKRKRRAYLLSHGIDPAILKHDADVAVASVRGNAALLIRPFRLPDANAVRLLYVTGQAAHVKNDGSLVCHLSWLYFVLCKTGDMHADNITSVYQPHLCKPGTAPVHAVSRTSSSTSTIDAHGNGDADGKDNSGDAHTTVSAAESAPSAVGRSQLWVATMSLDDYRSLSSEVELTSPTAAASSGTGRRATNAGLMSPSVQGTDAPTVSSATAAAAGPSHPSGGTNDDNDTQASFDARLGQLRALCASGSTWRPPTTSECYAVAGLREPNGPLFDTDGRVIVGTVAVVPYSPEVGAAIQEDDAHFKYTAELKRMNVSASVRRSGIASALVKHAIDWSARTPAYHAPPQAAAIANAVADGTQSSVGSLSAVTPQSSSTSSSLTSTSTGRGFYKRLYLSTLKSMTSACALYESCGFTRLSPEDGKPDEYCGVKIWVAEYARWLDR